TTVRTVSYLLLTGYVFLLDPPASPTRPSSDPAGLLLVSVTTAPPAGAALLSVTVPVLGALPVTAVGLTLTPSRAAGPAGFTVSDFRRPLDLAVMITTVGIASSLLLTGNVFVVA